MARLIPLYVYWLRAPMFDNGVVYVGCAKNPEMRRKDGQRRYNMVLTVARSNAYYDYDKAKNRETKEIAKHWLTTFNLDKKSNVPKLYLKRCASISASKTGLHFSESHVDNLRKASQKRWSKQEEREKASRNTKLAWLVNGENLRAARVGMMYSDESRRKMGASHLGKILPESQKVKMSISQQMRRDREHLLHSGYGHPWRLAALDKATREYVESL